MTKILSRGFVFPVLLLLVLAMSSFSAIAASDDEGLYDAVPPEGSAFVRFIHAQSDLAKATPKVNGRTRDEASFGEVKPYGVVKHGKINIEFGTAKMDFDAEAKGHYTIILQNNALRMVKDPEPESDLKAQVIVYNLTEKEISLKTADGKVSVIGPVAAGEMKQRDVNPIKVSFAVYAGEEKYADLSDVPLERKASYVIAVFDQAGTGLAAYERAHISEE